MKGDRPSISVNVTVDASISGMRQSPLPFAAIMSRAGIEIEGSKIGQRLEASHSKGTIALLTHKHDTDENVYCKLKAVINRGLLHRVMLTSDNFNIELVEDSQLWCRHCNSYVSPIDEKTVEIERKGDINQLMMQVTESPDLIQAVEVVLEGNDNLYANNIEVQCKKDRS